MHKQVRKPVLLELSSATCPPCMAQEDMFRDIAVSDKDWRILLLR